MRLAEIIVKWPVTVTARLGTEIWFALEMTGQILHRTRAHLNVPG